MSATTQNIEVIIPAKIKTKMDEGELKITGTQIRDKKGRIKGNLDYLVRDKEQFFSPHIFQSFEQCTFISNSICSSELHKNLKELQGQYLSLELKVDKILARQANTLVAAISEFDEHFQSLLEGSSLTSEKETFKAGVHAAALLAANMESYLNDFKNSTIVFHSQTDYKGETLSDYNNRAHYKSVVTDRKSLRFCDHQVNFFIK